MMSHAAIQGVDLVCYSISMEMARNTVSYLGKRSALKSMNAHLLFSCQADRKGTAMSAWFAAKDCALNRDAGLCKS